MEFDFVSFISQVGFPIAVASYSLVVLNKTIKENTRIMIKIGSKLDVDTADQRKANE